VAPLSVARQTQREAKKINIEANYVRNDRQLCNKINITNYEMIDGFNGDDFHAIILDESSILKGLNSKTRKKLIKKFIKTPYKLCCTATPAPNDISEIANHAEFLGILTRTEMLATFFINDTAKSGKWRLKKHAEEPFYQWMASWGMSLKHPSNIGYSDNGYKLPPLLIEPAFVRTGYRPKDSLFFMGLKGIQDRIKIRKKTLIKRVEYAAEKINSNSVQWIAWCGLNEEARALKRLIPDSVNVQGSDTMDSKIYNIEAFQDNKIRVLITKPKIAGFGMNFQNTNQMVFVGLSDSWESYYQSIRRSYRFGQNRPVKVYIVLAEEEDAIYDNIKKKESEANRMSDRLIENVKQYEADEIKTIGHNFIYETDERQGKFYKIILGVSAEQLKHIKQNSIGLSVFSPPFISLYTYSATERDVGNSRDECEFFEHFSFIIKEILRVTQSGRLCAVHVSQIPAMLVRDGYIGLKDFRGKTIKCFEENGWIFHGDICIDKDPQVQAIRTKSKSLLFSQLKKDSSWLRPALADYILVFRKPGENINPIKPDISNNEWIMWARPVWFGIRESDTLQFRKAKGQDDERHICPLQLGVIERVIKLWSNPGDIVLSPFAGIGSEGYMAIKLHRKFTGIELKKEYYEIALKNLREISGSTQLNLFDLI